MDLHKMLTLEEAAEWLRYNKRDLGPASRGAKGRPAKVPGFWLSERTVLFHPATVIAHLAQQAGVPAETIATALSLNPDANPTTNQK